MRLSSLSNSVTGALSFVVGPDFEAPTDAGLDNIYDVIVRASDAGGLFDDQAITITVADVNGNLVEGAIVGSPNDIMNAAGVTVSNNIRVNGVAVPPGTQAATEEEDTINGLGGNDTLFGLGGNDIIDGGAGNDVITAGDGNDIIRYTVGAGMDNVIGGGGADTLEITTAGVGGQTVTASYNNATLLTRVAQGATFVNINGGPIESVTLDLGAGVDTLTYIAPGGVTVNLATGVASGFTSILGVENVTGNGGIDDITGDGNANVLIGGGQNDILNGGGGGDTLTGGVGADTINTGAADDNLVDLVRFSNANEFGDTVANFDATGANADRVEFGGTLNAALDDGNNNDNFLFATGNGVGGTVNATVGQGGGDIEALLLTGAGGEGVTTANLGNAALVSAAFNAEFAITAANGEDALLVVNDTDGNSFSVWQWIQAGGGETTAAELTLIGVFTSNATVTAGSFDFFP